MDCGEGNRPCHNRKQGCPVYPVHHDPAEPVCPGTNQKDTEERQRQRHGYPGSEISFGLLVRFTGDTEAGDCRLNSGGTDREKKGKDRKDQLIHAEALCTNRSGEEYFIVETDKSADDPGSGQDQGTGKEGAFCIVSSGQEGYLAILCMKIYIPLASYEQFYREMKTKRKESDESDNIFR
ncbi:MAG: hypothetical protein LUD53_03680 [Clostridiales bacterium]|nr:hypothetical protein [Clostridiales bacterium]